MAGYVFKRYELKYLLDTGQYNAALDVISARLEKDRYGKSTIQSLYFDTDDYRLIRRSLEKPTFKEKLRLRCYGPGAQDKKVFLEMKRKFEGIVYKRRIAVTESEAKNFALYGSESSQIEREIRYFFAYYGDLAPKMLILSDRTAFFDPLSELRVTFDRNIRYRTDELNFYTSFEGKPILAAGNYLMEIKCGSAMPLWLCSLLSREKIKRTSFSKYGTAYLIEKNSHKERRFPSMETKVKKCSKQFLQTEA